MTEQENSTNRQEKNYNKFIDELTKLSKKYGVVIQAIGGVEIGEVKALEYSRDYTSGDLIPEIIKWEE
jgi:hypothetical protein